ncbi:hypothetical protein Tco_1231891 [Tanacetum coccineum]
MGVSKKQHSGSSDTFHHVHVTNEDTHGLKLSLGTNDYNRGLNLSPNVHCLRRTSSVVHSEYFDTLPHLYATASKLPSHVHCLKGYPNGCEHKYTKTDITSQFVGISMSTHVIQHPSKKVNVPFTHDNVKATSVEPSRQYQCSSNKQTTRTHRRKTVDPRSETIVECPLETATISKEKELDTGGHYQVPFNKGSSPLTSDIIQPPSGRVNGPFTLDNLKATSVRLTNHEHIDVAYHTQCMYIL